MKCDRLYYKVPQVLESVTVVTRRNITRFPVDIAF